MLNIRSLALKPQLEKYRFHAAYCDSRLNCCHSKYDACTQHACDIFRHDPALRRARQTVHLEYIAKEKYLVLTQLESLNLFRDEEKTFILL